MQFSGVALWLEEQENHCMGKSLTIIVLNIGYEQYVRRNIILEGLMIRHKILIFAHISDILLSDKKCHI